MTGSRSLYFSVSLPQHVGFTDQILLIGMLYKLGSRLDLEYQYSPINPRPNLLHAGGEEGFVFDSQGQGTYSGIFEFLGFDWYFSEHHRRGDIDDIATVDFRFDQASFEQNAIADLQDLLDHLKRLVEAKLPAGDAPLQLRFVLEKQIEQLLWLHQLPNSLLDFDFADIYRRFRQGRAFPDVFESGKPRILMHIRQGDTAVIETPWHSFIQIWPKGRDKFVERDSPVDIRDHQRISVADFESFYADLKSGLEEFSLSTLVHSDGFARAFYSLDMHIEKLALSGEQLEQLQAYRDDYNDREFEIFRRHGDARVFVGEDLSLLFDLMHAFYTADVVIIGTQQRMLAKQYAYSFARGGGPLLITLYRREFPYYNYFGNVSMLENCLYVNLEDYHMSEVIERTKSVLRRRYIPDHAGDGEVSPLAPGERVAL